MDERHCAKITTRSLSDDYNNYLTKKKWTLYKCVRFTLNTLRRHFFVHLHKNQIASLPDILPSPQATVDGLFAGCPLAVEDLIHQTATVTYEECSAGTYVQRG